MDLWQMDVRRFGGRVPLALVHAQAGARDLRDLLRHPLPVRGAPGRPAAARLACLRVAPRATPPSARSRAGSASTGTSRTPPRRRVAAAARLGREALVARDRRGARGLPGGGGDLRQSSFAKLEVAGPGAAKLLERLCDNRVAREVGRVTYTQMLNSRGGIECDFTVARLGEELFSIVTGTAFGNHDREWIRRHLPDDGSVQVRDVTSAWACFGIWGPRSRTCSRRSRPSRSRTRTSRT